MTPADIDTLAIRALYVMRKFIGQGETEGNNRGSFIHYTLEGHKLSSPAPAWCALTCRRAYVLAYEGMFSPVLSVNNPGPPAWLYRDHARRIPEPGALRLVAGMGQAGRKFKDPKQAKPGDLGLMKRPDGHHVYMVEHVDGNVVHSIEGNVGKFPAKVKRMTRDVLNDVAFVTFASLRKEQ